MRRAVPAVRATRSRRAGTARRLFCGQFSCRKTPPPRIMIFVVMHEPVSCRRSTLLVEPDEELVLRSRLGDRQAFARLVERYEQPALVVARSILHSWHDARDAVQDAFVTAFTKLNRLWSPCKFGAWFIGIVRHQAL